MEELKGIDLSDSWVMYWHYKENELYFDIEASIWPESKYYEDPKEGEYTCYKKARVSFSNIQELSGLISIQDIRPAYDANNDIDYGNIDVFEVKDNGYFLAGEFGEVNLIGGDMHFEIKET